MDDRGPDASPWHYLPVEVGAGNGGAAGDAVVRRATAGRCSTSGASGPSGFRGWSGGARSSFVIAAAERDARVPARRGRWPGLWQVVIGLHRVPASDGCRGATGSTAEPGRRAGMRSDGPGRLGLAAAGAPRGAGPRGPARRRRVAARRRPGLGRWLAGRPARAHGALRRRDDRAGARRARGRARPGLRRGHRPQHGQPSRRASGRGVGRYGVTLLPGQEVTTARGHAGVLGDTGWIDFRRRPTRGWTPPSAAAG